MYNITEEQITFILEDIRSRGVTMEDLQLNLLDHVCCIIERELEADGDFGRFYQTTITRFYERELNEIEDETIQLLTFKNYYTMKKLMIAGGIFSALAFISGSVFKVLHWPGANVMLVSGITFFSFLFLPLLFLLKSRETKRVMGKAVLLAGAVTAILFCVATLFRVMHWPAVMPLTWATILSSAFVLLPLYFFNGINKPESRLNTIIVSVVLIGITGLQLLLINVRPMEPQDVVRLENYVHGEQLLASMQEGVADDTLAKDVNEICDRLKAMVLVQSIGVAEVPDDFTSRGMFLKEMSLGGNFSPKGAGSQLLGQLRTAVTNYNVTQQSIHRQQIPVAHSVLAAAPGREGDAYTNLSMLASITQIQLALAGIEAKKAVAMK